MQNKETAATGPVTGAGAVNKPRFTNTKGAQVKEIAVTGPVTGAVTKPVERLDAPKKFVNTGLLNKASEENTKVKAPTKDYLEADSKTKYKDEAAVEIEKRVFVNKNVGDATEPHFKDINKNEDVNIFGD